MSLGLTIGIKKTFFPSCGIYGNQLHASLDPTLIVSIVLDTSLDPLGIRQHVLLKMLMNAHSTAVMARLGRVVGNTMTSVIPGNLKLVDRATYLIQTHVNEALAKTKLSENYRSISYADSNAVLFDAMNYLAHKKTYEQDSIVELAIIRILEAMRTNRYISLESTEDILHKQGLEDYLNFLKKTTA